MNDKEREVDDSQPRIRLKKAILESENSFCNTYIVEKHLLLKYLNHLRYLKIKQENRKHKNKNFAKNKIKNCSVSMIGKD